MGGVGMTTERVELVGWGERVDGVERIDEATATAAGRPGFEGSYLGDASALRDDTRLECKICWWVYDPVDGDPVWQIAAGTPFSALPAHWRCPQCDGEAEQFMVLPDPSAS